MTKKVKNEKGFTLVEVVVVAILMSALALGAFSMYMMYSTETQEAAANLRMQRQCDALMDEVSSKVREASFIFNKDGVNETAVPDYADIEGDLDSNGFQPCGKIFIKNNKLAAADVTFEFAADGAVLKDGEPVMYGGKAVTVDKSKSAFLLLPDRKQVGVQMALTYKSNNGKTDTLTVQRGVFRCRID